MDSVVTADVGGIAESPDTLDTPVAVDNGDNEDIGNIAALDRVARADAKSEKCRCAETPTFTQCRHSRPRRLGQCRQCSQHVHCANSGTQAALAVLYLLGLAVAAAMLVEAEGTVSQRC